MGVLSGFSCQKVSRHCLQQARIWRFDATGNVWPGFFEEDVRDLVALMNGLGLTAPVFLCAFSDGGTIALMFAVRHPERVKAMVCSGAHIYVDKTTV